jgi:hypothetical protein
LGEHIMPCDSIPRILPTLIVNGASPSRSGQRRPGQHQRDFVAGLEVLRAAHDLAFALAVIDAADGELVGIRMLVAGDDLRDDHAFEFAAELLDPLDLEAEQGEAAGQFFG